MKNDFELLQDYLCQKDTKAFDEIVSRHHRVIYNVCLRILLNPADAQDACQSVFLVLLKKADKLKENNLAGWLYKVAVAIAKNMIRAETRLKNREAEYAMIQEQIKPINISRMEAEEINLLEKNGLFVQDSIAVLPDKYRMPLVAHYFEGQATKDIAEQMGVSQNVILVRLHRAVEKLRKKISRKSAAGVSGAILIKYLTISNAQAAPAEVTASLCNLAASGTASAVVTNAAATAITAMQVAKIKLIIGAIIAVAVVGAGGYGIKEMTKDEGQTTKADIVAAGDRTDTSPEIKKEPKPDVEQSGEWGKPVNGLQLSILADKGVYAVGEDVKIFYKLRNISKERKKITLYNGKFDCYIYPANPFKISDSKGHKIKYIGADKRLSVDLLKQVFFKPGDILENTYRLNQNYNIKNPDTYSIIGEVFGLTSNTIVIKVED